MNPQTRQSGPVVADRIAQQLKGYGVTVMFSQSLPSRLVLACEDVGIRQVVYRTENAGGAMADAFARISNRVGIVCAQNGPAATLLVPPLAEALKASIPVVALVQEVPRNQTDRNAFQDLDHHALFSSCTKWVRTIRSAERAKDYVRQAFIAATSGRPGPVALLLPADLLNEPAPPAAYDGARALGAWPLDRPVADPEAVSLAAELIANARAPLVIAGGGIHGAQAAPELAALQEGASLPVATTMMGKGAVDERHPLSIGLIGNVMGRRSLGAHTRRLVDEADVILLLGSRTNQNGTDSWQLFPRGATIIHADIDGQEVGRNYEGLRLVGDVKRTLEALRQALDRRELTGRKESRAAVEAAIAAARAARSEVLQDGQFASNARLHPEQIMAELDPLLTSETIVVADASYSSVWINAFLGARAPGMRFLTPRGLAGLGWGLPMAVGAKLAAGGRPVVCLAGDGGFGHCWSELETLVREKIALTLIVLNNGTLGYQKDAEHVKFGRHTGACYFGAVDHAAIARACGCAATRVASVGELQAILPDALASASPTLIDIATDPLAYPPLTMYDGTLEAARLASAN
jgi:acetolactate synthase-1/2/3 large subunit